MSAIDAAAAGDEGGAKAGLCHVCAAEAELDRQRPVATRHGRVQEKGASGFTGWVEGLQRPQDPALLKRLYKATRPDDAAKLCAEMSEVDGAMEVDEIDAMEEDEEDEGAKSAGDESSDDEEDEVPALRAATAINAGRKLRKRHFRRAYEAEGDLSHLVFNAKAPRKGKGATGSAGAGGEEAATAGDANSAQATRRKPAEHCVCTACRNPLFESVAVRTAVYAHPSLGVALCFYCYVEAGGEAPDGAATAAEAAPPATAGPGAEAAAEGEAAPMDTEEGAASSGGGGGGEGEALDDADDDKCLWCGGASPDEGFNELLLCDSDGCGKAVCEGCIRLNLGEDALAAARAADPWYCYACDGGLLRGLKEACTAERAQREQSRLRREAREKAAAERMRDRVLREEAARAGGGAASPSRRRRWRRRGPRQPAAAPRARRRLRPRLRQRRRRRPLGRCVPTRPTTRARSSSGHRSSRARAGGSAAPTARPSSRSPSRR